MRKFSFKTLLAATLLTVGMSASAAITVKTMDPESGSTVETLEKVKVTTDTRYVGAGWEYQPTSNPVYDKARNVVAYVDFEQGEEYGDMNIVFRSKDPVEQYGWTIYPLITLDKAGTYTFTVPAGAWNNDGDATDVNTEFSYTITITGGGAENPDPSGPKADITLVSVDPLSGSMVDDLAYISLYFSHEGMLDCTKVSIHQNTADGATIGEVYEGDMDWNDATHFNLVCTGNFKKGNTYVVVLDEGAITNEEDMQNVLVNAKVELTYTIKQEETPGPVVGTGLTVKMTNPKTGDKLVCDMGKTMASWNVQFSEKVELVSADSKPVLTCSDGNSWTGEYNLNFQDFGSEYSGYVICRNFFGELTDKELPSGTYTLTIPAGTFKGTSGLVNEEVVVSIEWTQSADYGNDDPKEDTTPLELRDVQLVMADGATTIDLLTNPDILSFGRNAKIRILTNKASDETVRALYLKLYDKEDPETLIWSGWTYTQAISSTQSITHNGKGADGYFEFEYYQTDEFVKGHEYVLNITAWNKYDGVAEAERVSRGEADVTFKGAAEPFEYADIDILKVTPAPGDEIDDIDNPNIVIKYSEPVEVIQFYGSSRITGLHAGQAGVQAFEDIIPNADKTTWTFVISKSTLESYCGSMPVFVAAQSLDGKRVYRDSYTAAGVENSGDKTLAKQALYFECFLGAASINVTPEAGQSVDKLYSFKFDFNGGNIDYQGINAKGQRIFPKLLSSTGAVVANMVYADEEIEREATSTGRDDKVLSVTMHLDKEVLSPGKYVLYVPSQCFITGTEYAAKMNKPLRLAYFIDGDYEVSAASIADGSNVKELGVVSLYVANEVNLADGAKMLLRRKGATRTIKEVELKANDFGTHTRIDADFNDADNAFAPFAIPSSEEYKEFELVVEKGALVTNDGAQYAEKLISFVSTDEYMPETVALSFSVAGHASASHNVHKGSTATLNLTPAENWMLESLKFNGADVTADAVGSSYTTPALTEDAEVEATYKYDGVVEYTSGVLELNGTKVSIEVVDGKIYLKGLAKGDVVNVYTLGGSLASSYVAPEESIVVTLAKGSYVVTVNGKNGVKVIL